MQVFSSQAKVNTNSDTLIGKCRYCHTQQGGPVIRFFSTGWLRFVLRPIVQPRVTATFVEGNEIDP